MTPDSHSGNTEIVVPVGHLHVRMAVPESQSESAERVTFWWSVTSSAIALAEFLCSMGPLSGNRVLELGCGPGLAGISAGMLNAEVMFTDYIPGALRLARRNAALNGLDAGRIDFRILDWEAPEDLDTFDLVIGSEILYDYFFHGSLIGLLERATDVNSRIILADRKRLVVQRFLGRLRDHGFRGDEHSLQVRAAGFPQQETTVFTLQRAREPASIPGAK